ncbi:16S rRNA (cytidine(1402)-2'-O)-methyltransferase [Borrelia miyamotoi]|uniref:Ribosomal RNA small subunit methyltransferase I n=1 Tax=Borrelia miyamotoi TaxID=47466 RepID=A0AAX3JM54_9SPIR|nr:16S rRNA (cytidine(1402)-2'-O)-methyltransferase [Borrelia miyamotoi]QFP41918.1 16S rRNA (cytidine(1402)-2'-O)-methyltransferase [Borrelia miyamotoi]QFP48037.1 16S rRNA (cytidine(1402)-2'-O)-methyltransferase [Borrelia miyamotoi]QGT55795.1 16S rRNA (cytidine(1402)-2'-O)-methyltransferase [Borrelia miyamotoi]QGT56575.1 16S rRNA (cytidine(1402)-2'-O)-methyltransferase [Borrelia miyamotoi]WAZ71823.1 16S rRNA (cytidine(1402)-2'-O)-methyltransferase [Borrelia miyamotoi]
MLYIVGTPIGNLGDITYRAIDILKLVDVVFAEDTRITKRLLFHYGIAKKLISCNAVIEHRRISLLLEYLSNGKSVAFVSDAGTPCISDPGGLLVDAAFKNGYRVCPIPGVSSFSTVISVNPFKDKVVIFEGFLPNKGIKRLKRIEELYHTGDAFVLLESNHRILKLLFEISLVNLDANVLVGREMTKLHEEYKIGKPLELKKYFEENNKNKGEFTVLVSRKFKS